MLKVDKKNASVKAGAAVADISPRDLKRSRIWMGGYLPTRYAVERADPVTARVVAIGEPGNGIVIVSVDTCMLSRMTVNSWARMIARSVPVPERNIFIAATHTHSGPDFSWLFGGVPLNYYNESRAKIIQAAKRAWNERTAAQFYAGVSEHRIGLQRRKKSGENETENKAVVLQWRAGGETIATLINLGCHGVVFQKESKVLSGDLPGALCRAADGAFGGISLFMPRIQGDVNPNIPGANTYRQKGNAAELSRLAGEGHASVSRAVADARQIGAGPVEVREIRTEARSRNAIMLILGSPFWTGALPETLGTTVIKMKKFRIGGIEGIAVPGEVLTGLGIELLSRFTQPALLFSCCGGYLGYLMTPDAYKRGGYEPSVSPGPISLNFR